MLRRWFKSLGLCTAIRPFCRTFLVSLSLCSLFICWERWCLRKAPMRSHNAFPSFKHSGLFGHASISSNICWRISHFSSVIAEKICTHLMKIWTTAFAFYWRLIRKQEFEKRRWNNFSAFSETADKSVYHATRLLIVYLKFKFFF